MTRNAGLVIVCLAFLCGAAYALDAGYVALAVAAGIAAICAASELR